MHENGNVGCSLFPCSDDEDQEVDGEAPTVDPLGEAPKADPRGESRGGDLEGGQLNQGSTEANPIAQTSEDLAIAEKTGVEGAVTEAVDPATIPLTKKEVEDELDVLVEKESINTVS